jgi:hypothetical protein
MTNRPVNYISTHDFGHEGRYPRCGDSGGERAETVTALNTQGMSLACMMIPERKLEVTDIIRYPMTRSDTNSVDAGGRVSCHHSLPMYTRWWPPITWKNEALDGHQTEFYIGYQQSNA